jgi:dCMP deaminase
MLMRNKDKIFFTESVKLAAAMSSCIRVQVGAILVKDGRIVCSGWNGSPPGHAHCCDIFKDSYPFDHDAIKMAEFKAAHGAFSKSNELHAEANVICFAAKHGISTNGLTLISSTRPCEGCAMLIIAAGIKEIFYLDEYDRVDNAEALLKTSNIPLHKLVL